MPDLPDNIPRGTERILFVDDDELLAALGSKIFGRLGYSVVSITDPKEALSIFSQDINAFDLLFTDLTMPEMKGDELAKNILTIRPDIPVILCTGFDDQLNERDIREMGIAALIIKPIAMKDMAVIVRKCLDGLIHNG